MPAIPRDKSLDSSLALLFDPYRFISKKCHEYRSDLFETRILLQRTICTMGKQAAELFYNPDRFMRSGATPDRISKTLFGRGGVQGLDGDSHRHRKQMFMSLMTAERIAHLTRTTNQYWRSYSRKWGSMPSVALYDELHELLCRAVCEWAGVPLPESQIVQRTRELTALFDEAGNIGPRHWWARLARKRADRWIANVVAGIRAGRIKPAEQTAAHVIAWHRDLDGDLLSPHVAAVELLNILRPTVAVSVYITFAAVALHTFAGHHRKLQDGEKDYDEIFAQEVRRFYPFFPAVEALVRHDFDWNGYAFPHGRKVLFDLYGTNHDARIWEEPDEFYPERFRHRNGSPFNFVPQGGGEHVVNHRCPGEWIAIELIKDALRFLATEVSYDVPEQDLAIDYSRLPALPKSHFIISNVRLKSAV